MDDLPKISHSPVAHYHLNENASTLCKKDNIVDMVQQSHPTSTQTISVCVTVSWTSVCWTLNDKTLPCSLWACAKSSQGDNTKHQQFLHWLHTSHQFFTFILLSDKMAFTYTIIYGLPKTNMIMTFWTHIFDFINVWRNEWQVYRSSYFVGW